ncbi:MAG: hypothetical protein ACEOLT_00240, partial [Candidatus Karelsulcia muelleri]
VPEDFLNNTFYPTFSLVFFTSFPGIIFSIWLEFLIIYIFVLILIRIKLSNYLFLFFIII